MANSTRIVQIKKMLEEQGDDPFLWYALAMEYISEGNDDGARGIFEELIHRSPDYHATYYHFAKLLERKQETDQAQAMYEKGMEITKKLGEMHAYGELRSAYDELMYD